ncbi:hypothetical protein BH23PSE1_BH23PSE1_12600 [soil metagenome]
MKAKRRPVARGEAHVLIIVRNGAPKSGRPAAAPKARA